MGTRAAPFLLAFVLASGAAGAHEGKSARALLLEPTEDRLVVLAHLKVTGDRRRRALYVMSDADRDGRLDDAEQATLRSELARRALAGIRLRVGTATVALADAQAKLSAPPEGPVELMVHGTAPLPASARVDVEVAPGGEPLDVRLLPGPRRVARASGGRRTRAGLEIGLHGGERWWATLAPSPSTRSH